MKLTIESIRGNYFSPISLSSVHRDSALREYQTCTNIALSGYPFIHLCEEGQHGTNICSEKIRRSGRDSIPGPLDPESWVLPLDHRPHYKHFYILVPLFDESSDLYLCKIKYKPLYCIIVELMANLFWIDRRTQRFGLVPLICHCIATWYAVFRYLVKLTELETSWGVAM